MNVVIIHVCKLGHGPLTVKDYGYAVQRYCRVCVRDRARRRRAVDGDKIRQQARISGAIQRARNPGRNRENFLRWKYGLTEAAFNAMLDAQGWLCAICAVELTTEPKQANTANIDRCAATGTIRGILCMRCRTALGYLRELATSARRAADYLEAHAIRLIGVGRQA